MDDLTKLVGLGAGGGLIAGLWGHIRAFADRLIGIAIVKISVTGYDSTGLRTAVSGLVINTFTEGRSPFRAFHNRVMLLRKTGEAISVPCEHFAGKTARWYWRGWKPVVLTADEHMGGIELRWLRGTFQAEALLTEANTFIANHTIATSDTRFRVELFQGAGHIETMVMMPSNTGIDVPDQGTARNPNRDDLGVKPVGYSWTELGDPRPNTGFDRLALTPELLEAVEEARRWAAMRSYYREKEVPWRRGWLLYGPPGSGKTSMIVALAQDLGMPLFRFDIGSMSNREFSQFWQQAASQSPCVVAIEDIDGVFNQRVNIIATTGGSLTFDMLLNTISGVQAAEGVFLVVSTNKLEAVDPALGVPGADGMSTRPGRLDRALEMTLLDAAGRRKIAARLLGDHPDLETILAAGESDSGAQFTERCSQIALRRAYEKSKPA